MVPAPVCTSMPDGYTGSEKRAKLFSVYLRPWVLDARWATQGRVPHITDLNLVHAEPEAEPGEAVRRRLRGKQESHDATALRSFDQAWRAYIRGQVVSKHAKQLIVQFMAAC